MQKLWGFLFVAAILLILAGCALGRPQNMDDLWSDGAAGITSIHMRSGSTGKLAIITEPGQVQALLQIIGANGLTKSRDQGLRMGYLYSLELYTGDKVAARLIVGGPRVKIDNTYYELDKDIPPQALHDFFGTLETMEE